MAVAWGAYAQQVLFSNRIDALSSESNTLFAFHQTSGGTALSLLTFGEGLKWQKSEFYEWDDVVIFAKTWPRFDSIQEVRWKPHITDLQLIVPARSENGLWDRFVVFDREDLSKQKFQLNFEFDSDLFVAPSYKQSNDTLYFTLGSDQEFFLKMKDGKIQESSQWNVRELGGQSSRSCAVLMDCNLSFDDPIWFKSQNWLGRQSGAFYRSQSQGSWQMVSEFPLVNAEFVLEFWKEESSWLGSIETQDLLVKWMRPEPWKIRKEWYELAQFAVLDRAQFQDDIWLTARSLDGESKGLIRVSGTQVLSGKEDSVEDYLDYFHHVNEGVTPQDVELSGLAVISAGSDSMMVSSSDGFGLSFWDGTKWSWLYNQALVSDNLKEVRLIPSVMTTRGQKIQVAYQLNQDGKISIDVFNFNMEHVVNIQHEAWRNADPVRSSHPREDFWDGLDASGRGVSAGPYYVRVKDQKGRKSWAKLLKMTGPVK